MPAANLNYQLGNIYTASTDDARTILETIRDAVAGDAMGWTVSLDDIAANGILELKPPASAANANDRVCIYENSIRVGAAHGDNVVDGNAASTSYIMVGIAVGDDGTGPGDPTTSGMYAGAATFSKVRLLTRVGVSRDRVRCIYTAETIAIVNYDVSTGVDNSITLAGSVWLVPDGDAAPGILTPQTGNLSSSLLLLTTTLQFLPAGPVSVGAETSPISQMWNGTDWLVLKRTTIFDCTGFSFSSNESLRLPIAFADVATDFHSAFLRQIRTGTRRQGMGYALNADLSQNAVYWSADLSSPSDSLYFIEPEA